MGISVAEICDLVEKKVPGTKCIVSPYGDQIAVLFDNQPDKVIHLLSPYYQMRLKKGLIEEEDLELLIRDVRRIVERRALADAVVGSIEDDLKSGSIS